MNKLLLIGGFIGFVVIVIVILAVSGVFSSNNKPTTSSSSGRSSPSPSPTKCLWPICTQPPPPWPAPGAGYNCIATANGVGCAKPKDGTNGRYRLADCQSFCPCEGVCPGGTLSGGTPSPSSSSSPSLCTSVIKLADAKNSNKLKGNDINWNAYKTGTCVSPCNNSNYGGTHGVTTNAWCWTYITKENSRSTWAYCDESCKKKNDNLTYLNE